MNSRTGVKGFVYSGRVIELDRLARSYGGRQAVRDLTLEIPGGEVFGLLGPNGAGKSTTLKMLATLIKPSGGSARIAGHHLTLEANAVRRVIGFVPEGADLYEDLSGDEFLDLVRDLHRLDVSAAEAVRRRLAESFELTPDLGRPIAEYSKGMKQKLLLIAALQHHPRVLLLDEPLDGLDVSAQEVLKAILREKAAAGCAVVYSSHILEVVEKVCDRVGIMHHGRLVTLVAPSQIPDGETLSQLFLRITAPR